MNSVMCDEKEKNLLNISKYCGCTSRITHHDLRSIFSISNREILFNFRLLFFLDCL